jgi:hypothetical protein
VANFALRLNANSALHASQTQTSLVSSSWATRRMRGDWQIRRYTGECGVRGGLGTGLGVGGGEEIRRATTATRHDGTIANS